VKEAWRTIDADGSLAARLEYEAKHRTNNLKETHSHGLYGKRGWGALTRLYDWELENKDADVIGSYKNQKED
jgi:hypothetical protein